jgi:HK97 family phage portal protein
MTPTRPRSALSRASRPLYGHTRGMPSVGPPRDQPSNGQPPGINPPPTTANPPHDFEPISVGPDASAGFGNTSVTSFGGGGPVPMSPWSGWPDGWATPPWSDNVWGAWSGLADVVFDALDLNSRVISSMPPFILNNGNRQGGRPWLVNPEPMIYPSWQAFCKEMVWSFVGTGEVFIVATETYFDGFPQRFMVTNPAYVQVDQVAGRTEYRIAGVPVDPDEILHIKYVSWPGDLRGHGPLEVAGARLLTVAALTRYATGMATSGSLPPAVIKYPRRASTRQLAQMRADWVNARTSGWGLPAVLADGAEITMLQPQLRDAALADLAAFSEARISTLLLVPPFLLSLSTRSDDTYVNSTNVFDFHWRADLRPLAHALCEALSGWLLPRGWYVELDADDYIKPGMFQRAQAYQMMIAAGVITPAEVRLRERFDTVPGDEDEALGGPDTGQAAEPPSGPDQGAPGRPVQTNTENPPTIATGP